MNKKEFREHCEKQIERCIKFNDEKHLKEHELSLALLNECEFRKKEKENLINCLENEIKKIELYLEQEKDDGNIYNLIIKIRKEDYKDLLEKIKSGKYE